MRTLTPFEQLSEKITRFLGSSISVALHSIVFVGFFVLAIVTHQWDRVLLVLTTLVSLEAIYLSLFIQMTVNRNTASLLDVERDIDEIQEDVDEIQEDIDEIQEDVDEIVDEEARSEESDKKQALTLEDIQKRIAQLVEDIEKGKSN